MLLSVFLSAASLLVATFSLSGSVAFDHSHDPVERDVIAKIVMGIVIVSFLLAFFAGRCSVL